MFYDAVFQAFRCIYFAKMSCSWGVHLSSLFQFRVDPFSSRKVSIHSSCGIICWCNLSFNIIHFCYCTVSFFYYLPIWPLGVLLYQKYFFCRYCCSVWSHPKATQKYLTLQLNFRFTIVSKIFFCQQSIAVVFEATK